MRGFWIALGTLTVLPVRLAAAPHAGAVARSRWWYPAVGLLLGAALGLWTAGAVCVAGPGVAAVLVLAAWIGLTGALHFDGWCDLADGLFARGSAADRLRVMKDPHVGAFGLAGGVLLLLGKFALLQDAIARMPERAPWLVATAVAVARCLVIVAAAGARYPRAAGTGKTLVEAVRGLDGVAFAVLALALGLGGVWLPVGWHGAGPGKGAVVIGLVPPAAALLATLVLRRLCVRRLDGVTGDCLGAVIEGAEVVFLAVAVLTAC